MIFEQFVLSESGCANGTLVREMCRFEGFAVIFGNVVQQLPMEHFATDWTTSGILAFVGQILHASRN